MALFTFSQVMNLGFYADYFTDRLCRIYGVLLFVILGISLHVEMNTKDITTCWTPAQFTESHRQYTNAVCQNGAELYEVFETSVPMPEQLYSKRERIDYTLGRRKYIPLIIVAQGLLFLLPYIFWNAISSWLSNLNTIIRDGFETQGNCNSDEGKPVAGQITQLIKHPIPIIGGFGAGYLLHLAYAISKFGFWLICLIQMGILSHVFGLNFFLLNRYFQSTEMNVTTATGGVTLADFPKVVLCGFEIRHQTRVHSYIVQCNVEIADAIQSHLYVMWAWLIIVLILLTISGFAYFVKIFTWCFASSQSQRRLLEKYLGGNKNYKNSNIGMVEKFGKLMIKPDSCFIFEMIEGNGSQKAAYVVMNCLWEEFLENSDVEKKGKAGIDEKDEML